MTARIRTIAISITSALRSFGTKQLICGFVVFQFVLATFGVGKDVHVDDGRNASTSKRLGSTDHNVAVRAAWARLTSRIPKLAPPHDSVECGPFSVAASRFVGVIEGRFRVQSPEWWASSFATIERHELDGFSFTVTYDHLKHIQDRFDLLVRPEIEITCGQDDVVTLTSGAGSVECSAKDLGITDPELSYCLDAVLENKGAYVSIHEGENPLTLSNIDRDSGRIVWKTEIPTPCVKRVGRSGSRAHVVELAHRDGRLFVFGGVEDLYMVEIDCQTGTQLFRFDTTERECVEGQ